MNIIGLQALPVPPPEAFRGPFPHGDVDLRGLTAAPPARPVRPHRPLDGRQFYFLPKPPAVPAAPVAPPGAPQGGGKGGG